jgi:diguanylate cyclase (GGDEF)-like protein
MRDELRRQATFDALTSCLNRASTMDALDEMLARQDSRRPAVVFVDLDDFKNVNDRLGHGSGDEVLEIVARRLRRSVREADVVGRIGGDEFLILCPGIGSASVALRAAERVALGLGPQMKLADAVLTCRASIGVAWSAEPAWVPTRSSGRPTPPCTCPNARARAVLSSTDHRAEVRRHFRFGAASVWPFVVAAKREPRRDQPRRRFPRVTGLEMSLGHALVSYRRTRVSGVAAQRRVDMATRQTRLTTRPAQRPTLGEETRSVARARIVEGAAAALAERGYDATADDIAAAAGVSRRTVFRHFATHDAVMEAAVSEVLSRYERLMPKPPPPGTKLESWLVEIAVALHEANAKLLGKAFWQFNQDHPGTTPAQRTERRRGFATRAASHAWRLAGGTGKPPAWVVDAFALQLSAFATNCLEGYSSKEAGLISARILTAVVKVATAKDG